jgi:hypothetical protein
MVPSMFLNRIGIVGSLAPLALSMLACSRSSDSVPSQSRDMSISEQSAIAKRYDPSSLVQVDRVSNLPAMLRSHFKGWMEPGETNGTVPYRFIIAGASDSSALVAFEEFGYVPSTHAISYVRAKDDWVAAGKWDNVGYPTTLAELQDTIVKIELPASGR